MTASTATRLNTLLHEMLAPLHPIAISLQPWAEAGWHESRRLAAPLCNATAPHMERATAMVDTRLSFLAPWQVVLLTMVLTLVAVRLWSVVATRAADVLSTGLLQSVIDAVKALPIISTLMEREHAKMTVKIRESMRGKAGEEEEAVLLELPPKGAPPQQVLKRMRSRERCDVRIAEGDSRVSGTLYLADAEHCGLLSEAYAAFAHTNPMHTSVFPSVRRMEREVVAMTAAMLGGGPDGDPGVCGAMTSGGSESILTAVKAARDWARRIRGVRRPEMVVAVSAHAAFVKAAEYFGIKLVRVPVGGDFRLAAAAVRRAMTRNTALVVASAPCYPHGVIDDVAGIAEVAGRAGVWCHVDACLGGFVLPFARQLGYRVPAFDFAVPGVSSMSVDTHKFGMAHKGTSVVLYRSAALRRHQYTRVTEWSGGLYISPGFAGSRSGALIATAWASMMHLGNEGFLRVTAQIMQVAAEFAAGVRAIPELRLTGEPAMAVVGFMASDPAPGARRLDVYALNDAMGMRGWHLNALQRPPALHMCFTATHSSAQPLLKDLHECVAEVAKGDSKVAGGMAPVYGMADISPDRAIIGEFLVAYQDVLLSG
ncbi:hypothetical protein WJX81_007792 [Elliptochloris bilobata]|uniref:sphinganine-1-phosphate aldolase n=1 Tax=Elliptochloris bilobata TaxID=381761 RepID=A0AAW1QZZ1_9CHLO